MTPPLYFKTLTRNDLARLEYSIYINDDEISKRLCEGKVGPVGFLCYSSMFLH